MRTEAISDHELVRRLRQPDAPPQALVDEYYRRCIPVYLEFLGLNWHTGLYRAGDDGVSPADQDRMTRHVADSIALAATDTVLDVGCGVGGAARFLAREYGCRVIGLTPVPGQRDMAMKIARRAGVHARTGFDLGHAGALPYADARFDAVLFFESPCHFPDRDAFFREAFRVLAPGGRLAGEDWLAIGGIDTDRSQRWLQPVCRDWAIPALGTGETYVAGLREAGFADVSFVDMRDEMDLPRGFATSGQQQAELAADIRACRNPFLGLILEGLASLGRAVDAGAFTIGRFTARKPPGATVP